MKYDSVIVGAGFAGATLAERLTNELGQNVLVIDERSYVGGSAHDYHDEQGILVAAHGAHVFHTNSQRVVDYLSRFTTWRPYEHRVLSQVGDKLVPVPINRTTVNELFDLDLDTPQAVEQFFEAERDRLHGMGIRNSEQQVRSRVGVRLFDLLYRDYTRKHWGRNAAELHASVAGRLPFRTDDDPRHFTDSFQKMPAAGYTVLFDEILAGIDVRLSTSWENVQNEVEYDHLFYTGPIDRFFHHRLGALPYRSCRWERRWVLPPLLKEPRDGLVQPVAVINEPSLDVPWTRSVEFRHITGQSHTLTAVHYEFPGDQGDPYYPVPTHENWKLYAEYKRLAISERPEVTFVGRLGTYKYMTMDQTVAQALKVFSGLAERLSLR